MTYCKYSTSHSARTSSTPYVSLSGSATRTYNPSGLTLTFTRANSTLVPNDIKAYPIDLNDERFGPNIQLTILTSAAGGSLTANASVLTAGKYAFELFFPGYGYAVITDKLEITTASLSTPSDLQTGYAGGSLFTVTGSGLSNFSQLLVDGVPAELVSATTTALTYSIPYYNAKMEINKYNEKSSKKTKGTPFADTNSNRKLVFDNRYSTSYSSSSGAVCYVGLDLGARYKGYLFRARFYVNYRTTAPSNFIGAKITGSADGISYNDIFTVDNTVKRGWNQWRLNAPLSTIYRYLRFEHNSTSSCSISELEFYDAKFTDLSANTSFKVDAVFTDGVHSTTWTNKVDYRLNLTPNVTALTPPYGSPVGGYSLVIAGTGFGTDPAKVSVKVDGVICAPTVVTNTAVTCTVGAKPAILPYTSFDVFVDGRRAIVSCRNFTYAFRYSDPNTWSGDFPPIEGDAVYVPKGMVLMVDQSTPRLKTIIVEGALAFSDENDVTVQAEYIIVNEGSFEVGTEEFPYQHVANISLFGGYYSRQLPIYGNKVLGCHNCRFDIHGRPQVSWTELRDPVAVGSTALKLSEPVDWAIGQEIVIAPTDYDFKEFERRIITAVDAAKTTLTVDRPFAFKHAAFAESLSNDTLRVRAEVGLVSRNVLVTGGAESSVKQYGAHILLHGTADLGLEARIENLEVSECGQPQIIGRHCVYFQMNGDLAGMYVRNTSIHNGYSNMLHLQAVQGLTVASNVLFNAKGHGLYLQEGTETGLTI